LRAEEEERHKGSLTQKTKTKNCSEFGMQRGDRSGSEVVLSLNKNIISFC
jgi:hypothetical protein